MFSCTKMYQDGVILNWHCSGWQGPTCQLIARQQERDNLTTDRVVKKGSRGASKSASKQGGASRNSPTGQIAVGKFEKKQQLEVLASFFGPKLLCYWKHLLNWSSPQKSLLLTTTPIATILFNLRHFLRNHQIAFASVCELDLQSFPIIYVHCTHAPYYPPFYCFVSTYCGNFFILTKNQHLWSLPSRRRWCRFVMQVIGVCMN